MKFSALVLNCALKYIYHGNIILGVCPTTQQINHSKRHSHSSVKDVKMCDMLVKVLPAMNNNYMYLVVDESSKEAAIVDAYDVKSILKAVKDVNANLTTVLTTHHHSDHDGGNIELLKSCPNLKVYGGDSRIGAITHKIYDNDCITVGELHFKCLFTPCHTVGHICFYVETSGGARAVFTGDTLFQAGCGGFFEGTAAEMYTSLKKLASLPDDTLVFGGHENTLPNLLFAKHVEPGNKDVTDRIECVKKDIQQKMPTVPSTLGDEKKWNPFMRLDKHTIKVDPILKLSSLRQGRNVFKA